MKDFVGSSSLIVAVVMFAGLLVGIGYWSRRGRPLKTGASRSDATGDEAGLRHPDCAAFEKHYGCPPPDLLRELYENPSHNLDGDFELSFGMPPRSFFVAYFMGMIEENMSVVWPGTEGLYPFASDGCGNRYVVDPHEKDPKVCLYDHETRKNEPLQLSLSEFLAVKRNPSNWGQKKSAAN